MNVREALDEVLRPNERVTATTAATPATSDKTVLYLSLLAVTNERVLEVSTPALSKMGIGRSKVSTVSVALDEIGGCDFRQGKLLWKNGGKNLVVVQTPRGEMAWATQSAKIGQEFAESIRRELGKPRGRLAPSLEIDARPMARTPLATRASPPAAADASPRADPAAAPAAGSGPSGRHVVGPSHGSLLVHTSRGGAAAKAGHDLILEVTSWSAIVDLGERPSIELTADPASIEVRSGSGGLQPLASKDRLDIEMSITGKVLGRTPITFTSSEVHVDGDGDGVVVSGALSIAGQSNAMTTRLELSSDGVIRGSVTIRQRSFGIRPFTAMLGALKVSDNVVVDVHARLPLGVLSRARSERAPASAPGLAGPAAPSLAGAVCHACGTDMSAGGRFCPTCGQRQHERGRPSPPANRLPSSVPETSGRSPTRTRVTAPPATRAAITALCQARSVKGLGRAVAHLRSAEGAPALEEMRTGAGRDAFEQPWRWLARLAETAVSDEDYDVAALLAYFGWSWSTSWAPQIKPAHLSAIGLTHPPAGILDKLRAAGQASTERLPADRVLASDDSGDLTAGAVRRVLSPASATPRRRAVPKAPGDRISPDALATFGRLQFVGADTDGVLDAEGALALVEPLQQRLYRDPVSTAAVCDELRRHAARGEWEAVGAWKFAEGSIADEALEVQMRDLALLAIAKMRVTNLGIHLAIPAVERYRQLTGERVPNDGFWGPPVFDSEYGPTRQYYLDSAVAAQAGRRPRRVPSAPGVAPGNALQARNSLWDFGMLMIRGPLVVPSDIKDEATAVRGALQVASNVDHRLFVDAVLRVLRQDTSYGWSYYGLLRLIGDYLDPALHATALHEQVADEAFFHGHAAGMIAGPNFTRGVLSSFERERYDLGVWRNWTG